MSNYSLSRYSPLPLTCVSVQYGVMHVNESLYVNRTFLVGVIILLVWTLQLLDLQPLDVQKVSVGEQMRNSAWMKLNCTYQQLNK